ncbi:MAG: extracellular solute-binding protein family 3, partial [Candidatus Solibacter sp.]|nr:extracellular solute-binding protein family 3 [Candidatus Solibacter sp.]
PNNLPFSNLAGEGFENRLAAMLAADLKADLKYVWWAERRSFLKNSLNADLCDVVMGVPSTLDTVRTTTPYYHSTYVFVERTGRNPRVSSLTDPELARLKIGIHLVGSDYAPPAHLLARQGIAGQLVGYSLYGPVDAPNPPSQIIDAVARGDVDVAIVWGPFAGYFSGRQQIPLTITPVSPPAFQAIPFTYGISAAVRKADLALRDEIEQVFARECKQIAALLAEYRFPLVQEDSAPCGSSPSAAAFLH